MKRHPLPTRGYPYCRWLGRSMRHARGSSMLVHGYIAAPLLCSIKPPDGTFQQRQRYLVVGGAGKASRIEDANACNNQEHKQQACQKASEGPSCGCRCVCKTVGIVIPVACQRLNIPCNISKYTKKSEIMNDLSDESVAPLAPRRTADSLVNFKWHLST